MTACGIVLLTSAPLFSQEISRAYCGKDGKAHVIFGTGPEKIIPPERKQVGCDELLITPDKKTVGWSVYVENCCTSYPIPVAVVLYKNGNKTVISTPQTIWKWHFLNGGTNVAVLSGPVHGGASEALIYDTSSGKILESWRGTAPTPEWAEEWEQEFEPKEE
jgi:hypothetical protein